MLNSFVYVICRIRAATPLEEMTLSWGRRADGLDMNLVKSIDHLSKKYVEPFVDVDKEDHITKDIAKKRAEKRAKVAEEAK